MQSRPTERTRSLRATRRLFERQYAQLIAADESDTINKSLYPSKAYGCTNRNELAIVVPSMLNQSNHLSKTQDDALSSKGTPYTSYGVPKRRKSLYCLMTKQNSVSTPSFHLFGTKLQFLANYVKQKDGTNVCSIERRPDCR